MEKYPVDATERFDNANFHIKYCLTLIKKYIRRTELMNQTLKTALVSKKGLTQKGNNPLMPTAHRDTIHRIASFF